MNAQSGNPFDVVAPSSGGATAPPKQTPKPTNALKPVTAPKPAVTPKPVTTPESSTTPNASVEAANPFTIEDTSQAKKGSETPAAVIDTDGNPFDIVTPEETEVLDAPERNGAQTPETTATGDGIQISAPTMPALKALTGGEPYKRFIFFTFLSLLVVFTILSIFFRESIGRLLKAFLNDNILTQMYREAGTISALPYYLFYVFFFFSAGCFLFQFFRYYEIQLFGSLLVQLLFCVGIVMAVMLLKQLVLQFLHAVMPFQKEIRLYNFTIIIFAAVIGILLIPANVLIAFGPETLTSTFVMGTIIGIGLIYAFRSLRGLLIAGKFVVTNMFHFLLYLCTIEIAPVLFLVKWISNQG